jgi:hypothetical protein
MCQTPKVFETFGVLMGVCEPAQITLDHAHQSQWATRRWPELCRRYPQGIPEGVYFHFFDYMPPTFK